MFWISTHFLMWTFCKSARTQGGLSQVTFIGRFG